MHSSKNMLCYHFNDASFQQSIIEQNKNLISENSQLREEINLLEKEYRILKNRLGESEKIILALKENICTRAGIKRTKVRKITLSYRIARIFKKC